MLKLHLSTRQERCTDLTLPKFNRIENFSFRVRTFVLLLDRHIVRLRLIWAQRKSLKLTWTGYVLSLMLACTIAETWPGSLTNKSWRHDASHKHSHGACHQLWIAVKNANTLERDTRAIATSDRKLLATATKVESVLDVKREAKIAKEMPKRVRILHQLHDNRAFSISFWLLRSVTSHFPAQ